MQKQLDGKFWLNGTEKFWFKKDLKNNRRQSRRRQSRNLTEVTKSIKRCLTCMFFLNMYSSMHSITCWNRITCWKLIMNSTDSKLWCHDRSVAWLAKQDWMLFGEWMWNFSHFELATLMQEICLQHIYFCRWDPKKPVITKCKLPNKISLGLQIKLKTKCCLPTCWDIWSKDEVMCLASH